MARQLVKYVLTVGLNLAISAFLGRLAEVFIGWNEWVIFFLWGGMTVFINIVGLVVSLLTLRHLVKNKGIPYADAVEAYLVRKIQRDFPTDLWTPMNIHARLSMLRVTGGKPLF